MPKVAHCFVLKTVSHHGGGSWGNCVASDGIFGSRYARYAAGRGVGRVRQLRVITLLSCGSPVVPNRNAHHRRYGMYCQWGTKTLADVAFLRALVAR
jgi:hypothetical protein